MKSLLERQQEHVLFSWSAQKKAQPLHIVEAKGATLRLANGSTALDFSSQAFNANLGHGHPAIRKAIEKAAFSAEVLHPAALHEEKALLGENLSRISPSAPHDGLVKSFLCVSGAEAVENAVKMARLITKRYKVITRYRSYHGASLGAVSYSGDYRRIPFDGSVTGVVRFPDPYERGSKQKIDTVQLLEEIIEIEGPETIACILLEGLTGANGVFVPPPDYWPRIQKLSKRYGIVLIADEVLSGFGRTGKWFAVDHYGITPDMMTVSKGLTGGYAPLGAVLLTKEMAQHFEDDTLWCGLSAYGNPLCCSIANAAIRAYEEEGLIENAAQKGQELAEALQNLALQNPYVAEVRSLGLLAAIDLQKAPEDPRPYVAYRAKGEEAAKALKLQQNLLEAGVFCTVKFGTVILAPPLCITSEELSKAMTLIGRQLARLP